ncbi:MAG: response regulator transcription factor [Bacteroidales bacterium]|nr:response regulator transcription factor [Bacteroidales bacterium]
MKCIVIDYDTSALKELCNAVAAIDGIELVSFFRTTTRAQRYLQTHTDIDLMFVDIDMDSLSGLQLVKTLVNPPLTVFTTANTDYPVDTIKVPYATVLFKPYTQKSIKRSIIQVREAEQINREMALINKKYVNNQRYIFVKSEYKVVRINFDDILYIESMREYVRFHLEDGSTVMSLLSIRRVENYLPPEKFMRVHRSYIINLDKVYLVERQRVVFDDQTIVPISDQFKDKFQDFLDTSFAV